MLPKFFPVFLLLICSSGIAQQQEIDSLLLLLKQHGKQDTTRLNLMEKISYAYYQVDPDKGLAMAEDELLLAKKLNDTKGLGWSYFNKGLNSYSKDEYRDALEFFRTANNYFEKTGELAAMAKTNNSIANVYYYLSDFPKALELYYKNLQLYEKLDNKKGIAVTLGNIGLAYKNMGQDGSDIIKAFEYQHKALAMYEQLQDPNGTANTLDHLGSLYDIAGKPDTAILFYERALKINTATGYTKGIAQNIANMGIAWNTRGNYPKAYEHSQKALGLHTKLSARKHMAISLANMGTAILKAPTWFLQSQGISLTDRYAHAIRLNQQSLAIAEEIEDVAGQSEMWENMGKIHEDRQDYKSALTAFRKQILLRDSIVNDEKKAEIERLELQYEFEKKEAALQAANEKKAAIAAAETSRQRFIKQSVMAGSATLVLAGLVSFIFYKKRRDAQQKQQEAELKAEISDIEMKVMRLQMNPHFIFNTLNSISDFIAKNDARQADEYLSKFARVMRMTLENSEKKSIPLADDLAALEAYMQLEAKRLNGKFHYSISVAEDIDPENTMVPPMIFQPFVENSIWHGIAKKQGDGNIRITITRQGEMLHCLIDDDGIGRREATRTNSANQSLGMKITKARLDMLNKVKKSKAAIELSDLAEGMSVQVNLPIELSF